MQIKVVCVGGVADGEEFHVSDSMPSFIVAVPTPFRIAECFKPPDMLVPIEPLKTHEYEIDFRSGYAYYRGDQ